MGNALTSCCASPNEMKLCEDQDTLKLAGNQKPGLGPRPINAKPKRDIEAMKRQIECDINLADHSRQTKEMQAKDL